MFARRGLLQYNKNLKFFARDLRKNMTKAERKLWYEVLKNIRFQFYRQKPIANFIADFYCPKFNLVIEVDGETHSSEREILQDKRKKMHSRIWE